MTIDTIVTVGYRVYAVDSRVEHPVDFAISRRMNGEAVGDYEIEPFNMEDGEMDRLGARYAEHGELLEKRNENMPILLPLSPREAEVVWEALGRSQTDLMRMSTEARVVGLSDTLTLVDRAEEEGKLANRLRGRMDAHEAGARVPE